MSSSDSSYKHSTASPRQQPYSRKGRSEGAWTDLLLLSSSRGSFSSGRGGFSGGGGGSGEGFGVGEVFLDLSQAKHSESAPALDETQVKMR